MKSFANKFTISTIIMVVLSIMLVLRQVNKVYKQESVIVSVQKHITDDTIKGMISYKVYENSIQLNQLSPIQKVLTIKSDFNYDIIFIIKMVIIYCVVLFILYKTQNNNIFQMQLPKYFLVLSILLICFHFFETYRGFFTTQLINDITNYKYSFNNINRTIFSIDNLLLLVSAWLYIVFSKAKKLQEENDLTI